MANNEKKELMRVMLQRRLAVVTTKRTMNDALFRSLVNVTSINLGYLTYQIVLLLVTLHLTTNV